MKIAFESIALVMEKETCIALIKSEHYETIRSVQEFFRELGRYWTHIECSLLEALVRATKCKPAIEELNEFVCSKRKDGRIILSVQEASPPTPPSTSCNNVLVSTSDTSALVCPPSHLIIDIESSGAQQYSDSVCIAARVNQVNLTVAAYERLSNIVSYVLGIPRFMMRLLGIKLGSIVISWATSIEVFFHTFNQEFWKTIT